MRWLYANALHEDDGATLDDLRESVETLGSVAPLLTRVFGPSHPDTPNVQRALKEAREALAASQAVRDYLEYLAPPARHRRDA